MPASRSLRERAVPASPAQPIDDARGAELGLCASHYSDRTPEVLGSLIAGGTTGHAPLGLLADECGVCRGIGSVDEVVVGLGEFLPSPLHGLSPSRVVSG